MSAARSHAHAPPARIPLEGGALALHEPSHAVPLVSLVVALRSGSAADPADRPGLARIALRMLRRGCEGMTSEQIDFRIDALGAEMAVDTAPSNVAIHAQVIARNVEPFVDLLAKLLATPTFPEDELGRLKRETVAEIIEARDSDRSVAQKALQRTLFAGHAYGRNPGGTIPGVEAITAEDVRGFVRAHLVQGNAVIGIAGDVTAEQATALAKRIVAAMGPGAAVADRVPEPAEGAGRRLVVVDKPERTQTQILVAMLGTSAHDEDHVPLLVANAVFGGTFTSRLMREVRSKRGWSYGASARVGVDRHRQGWVMWTFPAAEDAAPCLKLTLELLDAWVKEGVTAKEVSFIQRYLLRSHAFEIDTAAKRLHQALDVELLGLPADYHTGWLAKVKAVTPESASEAVKKRIHPENALAVVVGTASQVLEPLKAAFPGLGESSVVPFDAE
ncbi:MAG TPA: pitrilysin family protein [Polyangiaceae bacterium]